MLFHYLILRYGAFNRIHLYKKFRLGVDPNFDSANQTIQEIERELEEYLRNMKRLTGIADLKYYGTNKDRFQIEVPIHSCPKLPNDWTAKSQKKTHRRFWTPVITDRLGLLVSAEEKLAAAQKDTLRFFNCLLLFKLRYIEVIFLIDGVYCEGTLFC